MKRKADFGVVALRWQDKLDMHSKTQRVPGLDRDEIRSEMLEGLWRAWKTFDPDQGASLEQYWWRIWINRKADLIAHHFAQKRKSEVLGGDPAWMAELADDLYPLLRNYDGLPIHEGNSLHIPCPSLDMTEQRVWTLLSLGFPAQEVRDILELSLRKFYAIIHRWRTDSMYEALA